MSNRNHYKQITKPYRRNVSTQCWRYYLKVWIEGREPVVLATIARTDRGAYERILSSLGMANVPKMAILSKHLKDEKPPERIKRLKTPLYYPIEEERRITRETPHTWHAGREFSPSYKPSANGFVIDDEKPAA